MSRLPPYIVPPMVNFSLSSPHRSSLTLHAVDPVASVPARRPPTPNEVTIGLIDAYLAAASPASSDYESDARSSDTEDSDTYVRAGGTIAHFSPRVVPRPAPYAEEGEPVDEYGFPAVTDLFGAADVDSDTDALDGQARQGRAVHYWAPRTPHEVDRDVRQMQQWVLRPPHRCRFPVLPPTGSHLRLQKRGVQRWLKQYPRQMQTPPNSPPRSQSVDPSQLLNHSDVIERIVRMAARRVSASHHDWEQQHRLRQRIADRHLQL